MAILGIDIIQVTERLCGHRDRLFDLRHVDRFLFTLQLGQNCSLGFIPVTSFEHSLQKRLVSIPIIFVL